MSLQKKVNSRSVKASRRRSLLPGEVRALIEARQRTPSPWRCRIRHLESDSESEIVLLNEPVIMPVVPLEDYSE